jgi:hypothetical protein
MANLGTYKVMYYKLNDKGQYQQVGEEYREDMPTNISGEGGWKEHDRFIKEVTKGTGRVTPLSDGSDTALRYSTTSPAKDEKIVYEMFRGETPKQMAKKLPPVVKWNNKIKPEGY